MQPRAVEETILDNHIGNRANNPNTVAGAIDDAVFYEEVVDVASGARTRLAEGIVFEVTNRP